jgi:hypothetical protein
MFPGKDRTWIEFIASVPEEEEEADRSNRDIEEDSAQT